MGIWIERAGKPYIGGLKEKNKIKSQRFLGVGNTLQLMMIVRGALQKPDLSKCNLNFSKDALKVVFVCLLGICRWYVFDLKI